MLALSLHIGSENYAVPVTQVAEVLPLTALLKIPLAPDYIAGLLDFRGTPVPIVDLCALLTGNKHKKVLTTRIILIDYQYRHGSNKLLGLIAEKVTETLQITAEELKQSGVSLEDTPYLGTLINHNEVITQLIDANALLTDDVHNILFQESSLTNAQQA